MSTIFCTCLLIVLLGFWWLPIYSFIQVMKLNSYEELIELVGVFKDGAAQNKIIRIILVIFRAPLMIILFVPICIKVCKLIRKKNED